MKAIQRTYENHGAAKSLSLVKAIVFPTLGNAAAKKSGRVERWEGKIMDDERVLSVIETSRSGLDYERFIIALENMIFTKVEWGKIFDVTLKTIQRIQKEKRTLTRNQSERVIELAELYDHGVEVFEDKNIFEAWLERKSTALGGTRPKDVLDTSHGIKMIRQELGRLGHGIFA